MKGVTIIIGVTIAAAAWAGDFAVDGLELKPPLRAIAVPGVTLDLKGDLSIARRPATQPAGDAGPESRSYG